jgi:hypothetical protein
LALIRSGIALGVVAHQHLGEGRMECLDVIGERRAVLELERSLAG